LQNQSLKAHYKAGNISVGFFCATQGQRLPGGAGVQTPDTKIPSLMPWPIGHGDPLYNRGTNLQQSEEYFCVLWSPHSVPDPLSRLTMHLSLSSFCFYKLIIRHRIGIWKRRWLQFSEGRIPYQYKCRDGSSLSASDQVARVRVSPSKICLFWMNWKDFSSNFLVNSLLFPFRN